MKRLILFSFIVLISIYYPAQNCRGGWFNKSYKESLTEAIQSNNPRKVEKCLNKSIRRNDYTAICRIRQHARKMIWLERAKIVKENMVNPKKIQNKLSPWIKIDNKIKYFYKNKSLWQ